MNGLPRRLGCATPSLARNARRSFELVDRGRPPHRFGLPRVVKQHRRDAASHDYASCAILAEMMRSGSTTGSPRLILSTFAIPSVTWPQTVYLPSRKVASAKQMKN